MYISKVIVKNYRLLKEFEIDLREDLTLIVGKNNSGKTSVLRIMDKSLKSGDVNFKWNDFNMIFQKEFYKSLLKYQNKECIYTTDGIRVQVFIKYNKADSYVNIQNFMMDLNPQNNIIVLEFFYSCKEDMFIKLIEDLKTLKINKFEEFSKYMNKQSSRYFEIQRYSRKYDIDFKRTTNEISDKIELTEIKKLINFRSIKANREASNKVNDHSLSSLSQKYHNIHASEESLDITDLQKAIIEADRDLSEAYNGKEGKLGIFTEIFESMKTFGSETDITIQSTISESDLLKNNTTLYYKSNDSHLPESYNGLGYINLIGMIFEIETIISEFNDISSDINILFIEEPEAHTHPQLQYIFIKNIKKLIKERLLKNESSKEMQTIITTHSSHIVSECDFSDVRYLVKNRSTLVSKNFQELEKKYESDTLSFKFVKQYLNLNRSELFFTDKAIFIEGNTERILLTAMMQKIDKKYRSSENYTPLSSQNISIIEAGAYAHKFRPLIEFLGIKVLIITDIDGVEINGGKACASLDAEFTSNSSLKSFFELPTDNTQFESLVNKTYQDKVITDNIRIAYQTGISTTKDCIYQPRSFEDAFICMNFDFIKTNITHFEQGLKNKKKFNEKGIDYFIITQKCIAKKSAFATEILFYDGYNEKEWDVPNYIKEGLEWLQE